MSRSSERLEGVQGSARAQTALPLSLGPKTVRVRWSLVYLAVPGRGSCGLVYYNNDGGQRHRAANSRQNAPRCRSRQLRGLARSQGGSNESVGANVQRCSPLAFEFLRL